MSNKITFEDMNVNGSSMVVNPKAKKTIWKSITRIESCDVYKNEDNDYITHVAIFDMDLDNKQKQDDKLIFHACLNLTSYNNHGTSDVLVVNDFGTMEKIDCGSFNDKEFTFNITLDKKQLIELYSRTMFMMFENKEQFSH